MKTEYIGLDNNAKRSILRRCVGMLCKLSEYGDVYKLIEYYSDLYYSRKYLNMSDDDINKIITEVRDIKDSIEEKLLFQLFVIFTDLEEASITSNHEKQMLNTLIQNGYNKDSITPETDLFKMMKEVSKIIIECDNSNTSLWYLSSDGIKNRDNLIQSFKGANSKGKVIELFAKRG